MKSTKAPKMILNNALLEEEFFEEVILIGIVSPHKPVPFIHSINQGMGYQFIRDHQYEVQVNDDFFGVYYMEEEIKQMEHFIFTNRNKTAYLIAEAKHVDYIWMIKSSSFLMQSKEDIMGVLPKLPTIDYCFEINHEQLKSKQYLII